MKTKDKDNYHNLKELGIHLDHAVHVPGEARYQQHLLFIGVPGEHLNGGGAGKIATVEVEVGGRLTASSAAKFGLEDDGEVSGTTREGPLDHALATRKTTSAVALEATEQQGALVARKLVELVAQKANEGEIWFYKAAIGLAEEEVESRVEHLHGVQANGADAVTRQTILDSESRRVVLEGMFYK